MYEEAKQVYNDDAFVPPMQRTNLNSQRNRQINAKPMLFQMIPATEGSSVEYKKRSSLNADDVELPAVNDTAGHHILVNNSHAVSSKKGTLRAPASQVVNKFDKRTGSV